MATGESWVVQDVAAWFRDGAGAINLAKVEAKLVGDFDAPFRLRDRLESIKPSYDVIVIDTPPTLGLITVNALVAASHVLIPIQSSYFALEGTDDLLDYDRKSARET